MYQCGSLIWNNNGALHHRRIRFVKLWIHTQYVLVDIFIVGLIVYVEFVNYTTNTEHLDCDVKGYLKDIC